MSVGGSPLASQLAVVGNLLVAGNEAGQLARFSLPDLQPQDAVDVGGQVVWGPYSVGQAALLASDADELVLVGVDGKISWRQPLKRGQLGGTPLVEASHASILYPERGIARIGLANGVEQAFAEISQSAVEGPVAFGPRLLVSAADGAVLVVNKP